eukprot:TRINITY_DN8044_c0_g1_i3.p1 TRINITY_DN8044_c0_g1~~TRINITY_DN8044_c0_g1_i3.p1  ORF type:complete len:197 (+),score=33.40 TRINITY_DN8044_c0_g1_i3:155-745(+)
MAAEKSFFDFNADAQALKNTWTFWFSEKKKKTPQAVANYDDLVKQVHTFKTVEDFFNIYCHMARPKDLPASDVHLFKQGIKPMWEDQRNKRGGKWILRLRKGIVDRFWENIVMAVIGEQFEDSDDLCGVVLTIRPYEDIISLWNATAEDPAAVQRIRDTMRRVLDLAPGVTLEYKDHDSSLRDGSSFKNTEQFSSA